MSNKSFLILSLIYLLAAPTLAQFSFNFTSALAGWGNQSIFVVPANITEADGTQYWNITRAPIDQQDGQWVLDLYNPDGTVTSFKDVNNDLVLFQPDGSQLSLASLVPALLGITGGDLVSILKNNIQAAVVWAYENPDVDSVTNAQVNADADAVVDQVLAETGLPSFFLSSFRNQAYTQISDSLANAQATSAAINAAGGSGTGSANVSEPTTGATVSIPLNLTGVDLASLENINRVDATYGSHLAAAVVNNAVQSTVDSNSISLNVTLSATDYLNNGEVAADNGEWNFQWIDDNGEIFNLVNDNGVINVVDVNGNAVDVTEWAAWIAGANGEDVDTAVGSAVEQFVDAVYDNVNGELDLIALVGNDGINVTFPGSP